MVILWTQLDGGNQDPSERLAAEDPQDAGATSKALNDSSSTPKESPVKHPKVEGRPPSGRKPKTSSPSSPKVSSMFRRSRSFRSKISPPKDLKNSEKCVVSIKEVPFPKAKTSTSLSDAGEEVSPGGLSPSSAPSETLGSPIYSSTPANGKDSGPLDSCIVERVSNETPTRVTLGKNGTLRKNGTVRHPVPAMPNFDDETDEEIDGILNNNKRKTRKKFYSLPRNWKEQAADLFRNSKGKTFCELCKKKCSGEVLRVHDKYFHIACFNCTECRHSLAQGGFFSRGPSFFCTGCYQRKFGQECATCGQYVEGDVVSALGNTYHQKCFLCAGCRQPFPSGERVTYTGKECLCQRCFQIPTHTTNSCATDGDTGTHATQVQTTTESPARSPSSSGGPKCSGCKDDLVEGQALIALDQQWHIWCFKCAACNALLHGEYMGKDGLPYCEKDYQLQFGVKCAYCARFITGKVLQAGEAHHFHPTCARCTKCGDPFGDGEEMYLQGTAIWHPRCGPGPTENGTVLNGSLSNGHHVNGDGKPLDRDRDRDFDGVSSTASETQFSRSCTPSINGSYRSFSPYNSLNRKFSGPPPSSSSLQQQPRTYSPGLILREYSNPTSKHHHLTEADITRIYTYSYLAAEPTQSYLKRPIDPYDRPPKSPHFHRPPSDPRRSSGPRSLGGSSTSRLGMRVLVDTLQSDTPRPKSPKMNNEEPIVLSHFPGAKPPVEGQTSSRIDRDDFPAPPYPYTDPERRRRWSGSSKGVSLDEADGGARDGREEEEMPPLDTKLKKEEEELSKISTGIGKVFLQQVKEREKVRAWRLSHVDPRNASRTPSANKEPGHRMRFDSAVNASPSRHTDHSRPWGDEDDLDRGSSFRCSTGRSSVTLPSYNVVSSLRGDPKPGYGLKSSTLPSTARSIIGDYTFNALGEKTHSTDFSSARSDVSAGSLTDADRSALNAELCPSATYSSGLRGYSSSVSPHHHLHHLHHFRRSLPNMHHHMMMTSASCDPPKIYPAHLLFITNYRLPNDVDRCHLERHLSDADFECVLHMTRMEFYRLPEWRRNDIKRRARFF